MPATIVKTCLRRLSAVLILSAIMSNAALAQKKRPPAPVELAKAEMKEIAPVIEVSGTVISRDDAQLAAEVDGRVVSIADIGQFIKLGENIAKIDDASLLLQKREAQSKVVASQSRIGYLRKESKRLKQLAKNKHTSQTVLDKTISDYDVSRSDYEAALAQLAMIEDKLSKTNIRAPFDGYVTERFKNAGEYVKSSTPVAHLIGTTNIEIEASAPLMYVRYVQKGAVLDIANRSKKADAVVSSLVSIGTGKSRQFVMRLSINVDESSESKDHPDNSEWIPGMAVRVSVPTQKKSIQLVVPRDAMVIRRDGIYVFRVKEDNTVERLRVSTGAAAGELIAVKGDLSAGDAIVIRGNERLRPGQTVKAISLLK